MFTHPTGANQTVRDAGWNMVPSVSLKLYPGFHEPIREYLGEVRGIFCPLATVRRGLVLATMEAKKWPSANIYCPTPAPSTDPVARTYWKHCLAFGVNARRAFSGLAARDTEVSVCRKARTLGLCQVLGDRRQRNAGGLAAGFILT